MNICKPTQIQQKAIPSLLTGRDVLVCSKTGSGKTLTYVLPIIQTLQAETIRVGREDGTVGLILAPTRELVAQILEVLEQVFEHISPLHFLLKRQSAAR